LDRQERLLAEAELAADLGDWTGVTELARQVLTGNSLRSSEAEAQAFLELAAAQSQAGSLPGPSPDSVPRLGADPPRRDVTYFFSHFQSTWSERARFKQALRSAGFHEPENARSVGSDEEITGDGHWHHWAFTRVVDELKALEAADRTVGSVSRTHGVRYDGWSFGDDGASELRGGHQP
jgi:hypothetical protein